MSDQDTVDPLAGPAANDAAQPSALERLRALAGERARAAEAEAAARAPRRAPQRKAKPVPVEPDVTDTPPSTVALVEPDLEELEPADVEPLAEEADEALAAEDEAGVEEYADEALEAGEPEAGELEAGELDDDDVEAELVDDEDLGEPAAAEAVPAAARPARQHRERKRRTRTASADPRRRRTVVLLTLVAVVAGALAVWAGIVGARGTNDPQAEADASRAAAQAASVQAVKDLFTVDYNNPADWLKRVTGDSTGSLVTDYKTKEPVLFALLKGTQTKITATVQRAGADFTNAARTQASSLVIASQRQIDKTHPAGVSQVQGYQVRVSLVGGRWLATFVQPVGTTVS